MKAEIWDKMALCSSNLDPESAKVLYYALIKMISQGLRNDKEIMLPDLGRFYLHRNMPRRTRNANTGQNYNQGPTTSVKFKPDYKLRGYFVDFI